MKLRLVSPSRSELSDAFDWYETIQLGLGHQFLQEFDKTMARVRTFPHSAAMVMNASRKVGLRRFPYSIWYMVESEDIVVYAISHQHREPFYWLRRLS